MSQDRQKIDLLGAKMVPSWHQNGIRGPLGGISGRFFRTDVSPGRSPGRSFGNLSSKLAPKMEPRWPKNRSKNQSFFQYLLGSIFGRILVDFGCQNRSKLAPKWNQKSILTWKGDFSKIVLWLQRGLDFSESGGPSWEEKPIKDRSKSGIQDGMHLGIDF